MPLCSQADLEKIGQVDFTAEPDAAVTLWIAVATQTIESYCGREFEETSAATETLDGPRDSAVVQVAGYPVTAINSVTEDGTALTVTDDYLWYSDGRIIRVSSGLYDRAWTRKRQAIAVDYDYGWAEPDVPDDLRGVCANVALRLFMAGQVFANSPAGTVGPAQSLTLDGIGSVTYGGSSGGSVDVSSAVIGDVPLLTTIDRTILDRYRRRI